MVLVRRLAPALAFALLLAGLGTAPGLAQQGPPSLAEVRQISAVRESRSSQDAGQQVQAAQAYLGLFPAGRYSDEALLALAEGLAAQHKGAQALEAYERLITQYPASPLRDQALVQSLPLLNAAGKQKEALARLEHLARESPVSLHRSQALLWRAETLYADGKPEEALAVLRSFQPGEELSPTQQTAYLRLQALATWHAGRHGEARPLLERYLAREDTPENTAEALMLAAAAAVEAQHYAQAVAAYGQVIERYPFPAYLAEARFQRARLYAAHLVGDTSGEVGKARLMQAIAFFTDSLESGDPRHRAEALGARAGLLAQAGRPEEALRDLERLATLGASQNDPRMVKLHVTLLRQVKRSEDAAAVLAAAMANPAFPPPARAEFALEQAALLYDRKDCASVEALLNPMPIFADAGQRSRAFFLRGFCRYSRGDWQRASVDLEGLANDPAYRTLVVPPLLEAYERSAQNIRLTQLLEELIAAGRLEPSPANLERLARGYETLGEPGKILETYRRLAVLHPTAAETAAARLRQGMAEEALGNAEAAQKHFEAALAKPPADEAEAAAYLAALERLQPYLRRPERRADLAALNAKAAVDLKSPAAQARVRQVQHDAELEWGRAALAAGDAASAIQHLERARAHGASKDPRRAEVLLALAAAYAKNKQGEKGLHVFREELARTPEAQARAALVAAALAEHPEWGEALAQGGDREAAIRFYEKELKSLPPDQINGRYSVSLKLDALYRAAGNHAARAALFTALAADPAFAAQQAELNAYRVEIYREWGNAQVTRNQNTGAIKTYLQALALIPAADWRRRYQVTAALGQVYLKEKSYSDLVVAYENVLPDLADEVLQSQVFTYLGQVHLEWAREAEAEGNIKSARIRLWRALDYLPAADAERRAAAALRLAAVLEKDQQAPHAQAMLAATARALPPGRPRQQVLLALGALLQGPLKNPAAAGEWLAQADTGDTHPLSLEAAYRMADLEQQANDPGAAAARLEGVLSRRLDGMLWEVPIRYRLAVLYHRGGDLAKALDQYRLVAATKSKEAQERYSEAIVQARKQAAALADYLRVAGGEPGAKVAVPKVDTRR
jgi:tetratricopeptide (TPR) repeat protein